MGGEFHLKLNIGERPIANKYREGKMKSTLVELHSQTTRLVEDVSQSTGRRVKYGIVTLFDILSRT
jgi:hypothetical protein